MVNISLRIPHREDKIFGWLFFLCVAVSLVFDIYNFEAYETIKYGLLIFTAGGLMAAVFLKNKTDFLNLKYRLDKKTLFIVSGFVLWTLLSSIFALDKNYAFFGFYPRFTNGFVFIAVIGLVFLLSGFVNLEKIKTLLKVLFFCSGLAAFWGLLQSIGVGYYSGLPTDLFSRAAPSFMGNPNFVSMYVVSLVPLGLWLFGEAGKRSVKYYYAVSLFIQIWAVVIFSSRGSLLGLGAGICVSLVLMLAFGGRTQRKNIFLAAGVLLGLCALTIIFLNFVRPGTFSKSINFTETNIQQRLGVWKLGLSSFLDYPFLGSGPGNFELIFEQNRDISGLKQGFFDDPHNLFLYYLVSGGLPQLLLFLAFLGYPIFLGFKKIRNNKSENIFLFSVIGSVVAWAVAAFFSPVAIPCFVVLIILLSAFYEHEKPISPKIDGSFKAMGKVIAIILITSGILFIVAEHLFFGSIRAYNEGDFKTSGRLSSAAIFLNPTNSLYYEYRAGAYIRLGVPEAESNELIEKFSQFHKLRAYSYVQLANLSYLRLFQTQNPKYIPEILAAVNKSIALDPGSSSNYFALAQYYLAVGQLKQAELTAKKGLEINPTTSGWVFLAKVYQAQNNKDGLINSLYQALKADLGSDSLQSLLHLARETKDIQKLPFSVQLNLGTLD